jgi:anionic cell wall polymer biosynthesis LytR-Cps2A-Psr (LCP) family protein
MARQKCVMNAMLHQLDPATVFTKFSAIAEAGKDVIATDVPSSEIGTLLSLAEKGRKLPIKTVSFTPPLIYSGNPNFTLIRQTVTKSIAQSEALDSPATAKASQSSSSSSAGTTTKPKSSSTATSTSTGNTEDLNAICQVA